VQPRKSGAAQNYTPLSTNYSARVLTLQLLGFESLQVATAAPATAMRIYTHRECAFAATKDTKIAKSAIAIALPEIISVPFMQRTVKKKNCIWKQKTHTRSADI